MKRKTAVLLFISLCLYATTASAAMLRWDLQPTHFLGGDGVFDGNYQGTISGWFQYDAANPFDNSRYSFIFKTTTVSKNPALGYTFSSFNDQFGYHTGTIELGDATSFNIIGFVLIQNLEFRFPLTYAANAGANIPVSIKEVVGDVYEGTRYANTFATATTVPLSSSKLYFAIGLSVLILYRRSFIQKANIPYLHNEIVTGN